MLIEEHKENPLIMLSFKGRGHKLIIVEVARNLNKYEKKQYTLPKEKVKGIFFTFNCELFDLYMWLV